MITLQSIMGCALFKDVERRIFNTADIEIIKRPAAYIIKKKEESERIIKRIIILPPHGFTSNYKNETNPHPETRKAKIEIKGGIIPERQRFSRLDKIIKFQYFTNREIKQYMLYPYKKINPKDKHYKHEIKSSNQIFYVVEENGKGFYHSLVNLSDYWVLLILEKELLSSKK